jgi:hypothetical protein
MDARVQDFLGSVVRSIVGLEVVLFFQANPETFDTASGLALRIQRKAGEIEPVLERLTDAGVLEAFARDGDRYRCYALATPCASWDLLCRLSESYIDRPDSRKEIVRLLMDIRVLERAAAKANGDAER